MHSPFGRIWMIQKETGWTDDFVLWGVGWGNLQMKLADAPCYTSGNDVKTPVDEQELIKFLEKTK